MNNILFGQVKPLIFLFAFLFISCSNQGNSSSTEKPAKKTQRVEVPEFNSDSSYYFIEKQVSFGPRVPNTKSHKECGDWLISKLEAYSDTVYVQAAKVRAFDGKILNMRNIIGSINPEKSGRILLCAHWDTRPFADYDPDPTNHYKPIDGANDGASGVGVLLEIARQLNLNSADVGIDIIFFDAEDYGKHKNEATTADDSWALGSQYWSKQPHTGNYYAKYGILLDMVGAANATFYQEEYSLYFAPDIVYKVWRIAEKEGYSNFFIKERGGSIVDDHYYINTIRNIPTINIIHQETNHGHGFFEHWHTMGDNMDAIDKETLEAVGQTVLTVIYKN